MSIVAFDGTRVVLSEERWRHVVFRHPELKHKAGSVDVLKRLVGEVSDFVVVIYGVEGGRGYIRTAYFTSSVRKSRRYRAFRKLRLS